MEQDQELLQSQLTGLLARCVEALQMQQRLMQSRIEELQQEQQALRQQLLQQAAPLPAPLEPRGAPLSAEQKQQIQAGLDILARRAGWLPAAPYSNPPR